MIHKIYVVIYEMIISFFFMYYFKEKSTSTEDDEKTSVVDIGDEQEEPKESVVMWAMRINQPEYWHLILGSLSAAVEGMMDRCYSRVERCQVSDVIY